MSATNDSDYELLTEHFSYPPVSLLDDIINTVNVLADRALGSVERVLLGIPPKDLGFAPASAPAKSKSKSKKNVKDGASTGPDLPPDEAAKLEIENGTHQLETLLNASIDKNFDIFELYTMRNILTVAPQDQPYVRLSHYEGLDFTNDQSDRPTTDSITALRRRLQASQKLQLALETERTRNDALLRKLKSALGVPDTSAGAIKKEGGAQTEAEAEAGAQPSPFSFLRDKGGLEGGGTDKPITTTTEFTLSQLQALRSLSISLRTILPDLGPEDFPTHNDSTNDSGSNSSNKLWRRERAEYVETSSRKYLERTAGLELGPGGEVRDGEWQGEGRGLSKGEVDGLEKAVGLLGRTKQSQGSGAGGADRTDEPGEEGDDDAMDES